MIKTSSILSFDVESGSDITQCIKSDKQVIVTCFVTLEMAPINRHLFNCTILESSRQKRDFKVVVVS